jgi:hypothetical protein
VAPYTTTTKTNPVNTNPITPITITDTDPAFWPSTSTGGIIVAQTFGGGANPVVPLIADPVIRTGAVVALISHGKNGYGAFNVKGGQNDYTTAGKDEQQNADPAKLVTSVIPPRVAVVMRDTTEVATGGGAFDDMVMMISTTDLIGPLVANGTIKLNAQAAFNQANDIVLGSIMALKQSCTLVPPPVITSPPICITSNYYYSLPVPATVVASFPIGVSVWGMNYAG